MDLCVRYMVGTGTRDKRPLSNEFNKTRDDFWFEISGCIDWV